MVPTSDIQMRAIAHGTPLRVAYQSHTYPIGHPFKDIHEARVRLPLCYDVLGQGNRLAAKPAFRKCDLAASELIRFAMALVSSPISQLGRDGWEGCDSRIS